MVLFARHGAASVAHDRAAAAEREREVPLRRDDRPQLAVEEADRKLRTVIAPAWVFASPLRGGRAVVCNGCAAPCRGEEHHRITGGLWGSIDRRGRTVVRIRSREEDRLPSRLGYAPDKR